MEINKESIIKRPSNKKAISLNIRVTEDMSKWLKDQNFSPTGIFYEAMKSLECPCMPKGKC